MHAPHPRELAETRAAGWDGGPRPDPRQGRSRTARGPPPATTEATVREGAKWDAEESTPRG